MWLIGVDEAGYGPKLGPLVVAATAWHCEDIARHPSVCSKAAESVDQLIPDPFAPLAQTTHVGNLKIRVADSKLVYRGGEVSPLHAIVSIAAAACGRTDTTLAQWLPRLLSRDFDTISRVPWLSSITHPGGEAIKLIPASQCDEANRQWDRCDWKLCDVAARMIDAEAFNQYCGGLGSRFSTDRNKSDLLGETSITLAGNLLDEVALRAPRRPEGESVQVFFDRHGGRQYYAGLIQQFFNCEPVRVLRESKTQSVYETIRDGRAVRLHFSVKGDRHVPVALSSLFAKYLREIAMASLNDYFRSRVAANFQQTAGYPVDAERFIKMIRPAMEADGIADYQLIRCR